jgi:hypothetical protein
MAGMLRVPRSRGAFSGLLLVLLGAWGALIPFIGPYFHYAYTPDHAWIYNTDRLWLEVLPGAAVLLGGLITLVASTRPTAVFGSWLAALGGAWYVVGRPLSTLWTTGHVVAAGSPVGGAVHQTAEEIGFFTGLGVVILFFAAMALGRFTVIGAKEAALAEKAAAADTAEREPITSREPATTAAFNRTAADDTVADGSLVSSGASSRAEDGSLVSSRAGSRAEPSEQGSRWRLFGSRSEQAEPAADSEPAPSDDRPAGRHSA